MDDAAEELDRLRTLVGPSEVSYEALVSDRQHAERVAREALAETGDLRGRIEEMSVQLSRARQDQDVLLQRSAMTPAGRTKDRVVRRWHTSVVPRLRRFRRRSEPS